MLLIKEDDGIIQYMRVLFLDEEEEKEWLLSLKEVEGIIGYTFNNKKWLREAFIHYTFYYPEEPRECNQRLEYIGDSVLNFVIDTELFTSYPDSPPGVLTRLKSANVDNEKLARVAAKCGLHRFLRHQLLGLDDWIQNFSNEILKYPVHSNGLIDTPKILANTMEAVIGAVFRDSTSVDTVWKVFKRLLEPIISPQTLQVHPTTELHEFCQKNRIIIRFVEGSNDEKNSTYHVLLGNNNEVIGTATGACKKEIVKNRAAKAALDHLKSTIS
ncbi:hypothetical protein IFM89_019341 [Coptis chinensis]|uniref:RNase III domain-containing protein n=1 Tax=Coptis chinensis TaxID=261450 RepID=A0A835LVN9_9MAGN|nr:hypothetical protein IFM89_019341 [Coptis chinensis]